MSGELDLDVCGDIEALANQMWDIRNQGRPTRQ